jgi:hypothetical protein
MAAETVQLVKPIENLEELLLDMGLRLCISVEAPKGNRRWKIYAKRRLGVGDTRESAVANLLCQLGIELTFDDEPYNRVVRWGKPTKAYGKNVWLEGIGWGGVSEIQGWRVLPGLLLELTN